MAKANFTVPELKQYAEIPAIEPGAMAHSSPFVSKPEFQEPLGFPGELADDWQDQAIAKMGEMLGKYRSLRVYLDAVSWLCHIHHSITAAIFDAFIETQQEETETAAY